MTVLRPWTATDTTAPELFARNARDCPDHPALTDSSGAATRTWTWAQAHDEVTRLAAGFADLGLQPGQTALVMMSNRAEHWLADAAATRLGAVPGSVGLRHSSAEALLLARHSRARVVVAEGADQVWRWSSAMRDPTAPAHVVVVDPAAVPAGDPRFLSWEELRRRGERRLLAEPDAVDRHRGAITPDRPAALLYTGTEHCVVLTHRNLVHAASALRHIAGIPRHAAMICGHSPSDLLARTTGFHAAVHNADHVHLHPDAPQAASALPRVRPPAFLGAPEVWADLAARIGPSADPRRLRARLGLDRLAWAAAGPAPLAPAVVDRFAAVDIALRQCWGTAETTGFATAGHAGADRPGTAGRALPGVEVRISGDGEILVRGPVVCAGHLQPDGLIRPVTDAEGWLRTGDAGALDADGYLVVRR
ncbi:AMP-binding protein [Saccharopolyspora taberi]|uniref:AMP-dependent synthetase/ligase domain-containing protein n=1 Tax=Saccharopolyspora taberi TaxID=60895 RepID=A0ABN3VBV2_9PSEU